MNPTIFTLQENGPYKHFLESKECCTVLSLFREFLDYIGLKFTISAFEAEIEVGKYYNYLGRTSLAHDLKLDPGLYTVLNTLNTYSTFKR